MKSKDNTDKEKKVKASEIGGITDFMDSAETRENINDNKALEFLNNGDYYNAIKYFRIANDCLYQFSNVLHNEDVFEALLKLDCPNEARKLAVMDIYQHNDFDGYMMLWKSSLMLDDVKANNVFAEHIKSCEFDSDALDEYDEFVDFIQEQLDEKEMGKGAKPHLRLIDESYDYEQRLIDLRERARGENASKCLDEYESLIDDIPVGSKLLIIAWTQYFNAMIEREISENKSTGSLHKQPECSIDQTIQLAEVAAAEADGKIKVDKNTKETDVTNLERLLRYREKGRIPNNLVSFSIGRLNLFYYYGTKNPIFFERAREEFGHIDISKIVIDGTEPQFIRYFLEADMFTEALTLINIAIAEEPNVDILQNCKACALSHLQRFDEAQNVTMNQLCINPYNILAMYHNTLLQAGQPIERNCLDIPKSVSEGWIEELQSAYLKVAQKWIKVGSNTNSLSFTKKWWDNSFLSKLVWFAQSAESLTDSGFELLRRLVFCDEINALYRSILVDEKVSWRAKRNILSIILQFPSLQNRQLYIVLEDNVMAIKEHLPYALQSKPFSAFGWTIAISTLILLKAEQHDGFDSSRFFEIVQRVSVAAILFTNECETAQSRFNSILNVGHSSSNHSGEPIDKKRSDEQIDEKHSGEQSEEKVTDCFGFRLLASILLTVGIKATKTDYLELMMSAPFEGLIDEYEKYKELANHYIDELNKRLEGIDCIKYMRFQKRKYKDDSNE